MKRISEEYGFSDEQLNTVRALARECGLCEETVKILYGRGIRDRGSIQSFLSPSKSHFISPFKMSGMREAVDLITRARDESWTVVVYGDYDADGICATTVMGKALKEFGIDAAVCVPERRDGYGLSKGLIDTIFEEYCPELFITVDCGISGAEEVSYIQEQGAEVIVTDHHELPDTLPDCICVNPKFNDGYIYDNLCGAGVAFKVACALIGEAAYKYLDVVAIATVADSVPLTGENRDIVAEGLKIINRNPAQSYAPFVSKADGKVISQTLAFSVAPKINAAGRMGDAAAALRLFLSDNDSEIYDLSVKLTEYNIERQKHCDELYSDAKRRITEKGGAGKVIMLYNDSWNTGFVGIVAARLAEEYSRPAILFVRNGDSLKGSARSVENINIFEALKACESLITEFGGHSQAAGVNVDIDRFDELERALDRYIGEHYTADDFEPTLYVNGAYDGVNYKKLAKEIELLEPFGVGNKRPSFVYETKETDVRRVRALSPHLSLRCGEMEFMSFNGAKNFHLFSSSVPKKIVFEYNISSFRGKEYVKGFVRDVVYDGGAIENLDDEAALLYLDALSSPASDIKMRTLADSETEEIAKNCPDYGTAFIAYDKDLAKRIAAQGGLRTELFNPYGKNAASAVIFAPHGGVDLNGFKRVIYLTDTLGVRLGVPDGAEVYIAESAKRPKELQRLDCERGVLLSIYAAASAAGENLAGESALDAACKNNLGFDRLQTLFALKVFEQLSLISFESGRAEIFRGVKSSLENSELYNIVQRLKRD